jgi:membrane protein implicated in regulation of membrane protease activity
MLLVFAVVALFLLPAPWGIVAVASATAVEVLELAFWRRFLRRYRLRMGPETLIGERAVVVSRCDPDGTVRIRGELWRARSSSPVETGDTVRIAVSPSRSIPRAELHGKGPRGRGP